MLIVRGRVDFWHMNELFLREQKRKNIKILRSFAVRLNLFLTFFACVFVEVVDERSSES